MFLKDFFIKKKKEKKRREKKGKENDTFHRIKQSWSLGNLARHVLPQEQRVLEGRTHEECLECVKAIMPDQDSLFLGGSRLAWQQGWGSSQATAWTHVG